MSGSADLLQTDNSKELDSMALSNSDFMNSYQEGEDHNQPPSELLHDALNSFNYGKVESVILLHLDALDGVKSSIEIDTSKKKYPTGVAFVRDASQAKELEDRFSPDDPLIIGNNLLLRALGTIRGINRVLIHKYDTEHYDIYQTARMKIQLYYRELLLEVASKSKTLDNESLNAIHSNFNLKLSEVLHETNLNNDLETPQQHAKLFAHYRDLSSVLDPAKTMITIRSETKNDIERIFTETSYPVTKKTELQQQQLDVMSNIEMVPNSESKLADSKEEIDEDFRLTYTDDEEDELDEEEAPNEVEEEKQIEQQVSAPPEIKIEGRNYHAAKPVAFQIVDEAFVELIKRDDRRLPAQTRYTIAPTVKNGYVVHNEIEMKSQGVTFGKSDSWSLRTATMAYIGNGETTTQLVAYAKENLTQLMQTAKRLIPEALSKFNFAMLLTDISWGKQDKMVKITKDAIQELASEKQNIQYSYTPINILGTPQPMTISDIVVESAKKLNVEPLSTSSDLLDKRARIEKVGKIIQAVTNSGDAINIAACASGQDRTGTVQEVVAGIWEAQEVEKHLRNAPELLRQLPDITSTNTNLLQAFEDEIKTIHEDTKLSRALGCNNAILGTLSTPGSTGMKNDSRPDNYFSDIINKYFYRKTAKTNKAPPINKEQVDILYFPNINKLTLKQIYETSLKIISETNDPKVVLKALTSWAEAALRYQKLKEPKNLRGKITDSFAKTIRFGIFGSNEKEKARGMRNMATDMAAHLRDQKVLTKPDEISETISSLNKWREDNQAKYPKGARQGTVIRNLFELSNMAANQMEPNTPTRSRR